MVAKQLYENMKRRHTAVLGMTRSGKTYFVTEVFKKMQADGIHTIYVDPKSEISGIGKICKTPMQVYAALLSRTPAIIYYPPTPREERIQSLNKVMSIIFDLANQPGFKRIRRVIAIDEIQTFVKKGTNEAVEQLWLVGAGKNIIGLGLTQRLQNLNETVWSQSENKVIFKISDRLEYLKSRNLDHYLPLIPFYAAPENQYAYYATPGLSKWYRCPPIGNSSPKRKAGSIKVPKRYDGI